MHRLSPAFVLCTTLSEAITTMLGAGGGGGGGQSDLNKLALTLDASALVLH